MNEGKWRKLKYGALYGTSQCPGAGMTEKLREMFPGRGKTLAKLMQMNEVPINRKRESKRFEKRHGFKREHYDVVQDGGGTDGGSSGYED